MSGELIAGLDVGTQSTKAVVWQPDGEPVAEATRGYDVNYPRPAWAEQSPNDWLQAVDETLENLFRETPVSGSDVACLGLSSQLDGIIPVNRGGSPAGCHYLDGSEGP